MRRRFLSNINIGNSSNLITFTINGTEYQAEEGMTFEEWVLSDYNTSSPPMYIDNNNLIKEDMQVYYVNIFDSGNTLIDIGGKVDFLFNEKIYNGYKIILTFEPF